MGVDDPVGGIVVQLDYFGDIGVTVPNAQDNSVRVHKIVDCCSLGQEFGVADHSVLGPELRVGNRGDYPADHFCSSNRDCGLLHNVHFFLHFGGVGVVVIEDVDQGLLSVAQIVGLASVLA